MTLRWEPYEEQQKTWPRAGRHHVLAQFDDDGVCVYAAFNAAIAGACVERGGLGGGGFSFERMTWVKPNFLWMMFRSSWGTAENQEHVLALRVRRAAFVDWLRAAVPSTWDRRRYPTREAWQAASSPVRLQWDPDHGPTGGKLERRAVQIGLRGAALRGLAGDDVLDVEDISARVAEQRAHRAAPSRLLTPAERVFPIDDAALREQLGLDAA